MNHVNGQYFADLLPSHYHYLQFAYYKGESNFFKSSTLPKQRRFNNFSSIPINSSWFLVGDLQKACAAVSSYLLFYPSDRSMLKNQEYYSKLPKVQKDYFTPREVSIFLHS